jgi:hypothetical protein
MLFDLRVVLAACLATLFFLAVGLGLLTGLRSPLKASSGYARGPVIAGPGLPQERYLPVPEESKPEITGSVAEPAAPEPPAQTAPEPARAAPAAKSPSITTLIEEDKASREKAAKATKPAKAAPAARKKTAVKRKKRPPHRAARKPPPASSPFSLFTNKNTATQ